MINKAGKSKGEGFIILTIESSLIEYFATLQNGNIYKFGNNNGYYYSSSSVIYENFLNSADIFEGYFHGIGAFLSANDFYKNVRCGLIHETQTKNGWTVHIYDKKKSKDKINNIIFEDKKVYRTALMFALKDWFTRFCIDSNKEGNTGKKYRKHIARKLDVIFEIAPDNSFWWKC